MKSSRKPQEQDKSRSRCPVNFALEAVGDKWSMLIIRDIVLWGKRYYGEFLKSAEGISTNILASRLEFLESIDVLQKMPDEADKRKDVYRLTEKGLDLIPILFSLIEWGGKYGPLAEAQQTPEFKRFKTNPAKFVKEIQELVRQGGAVWPRQGES